MEDHVNDQSEHQCKPGATVYYCPTSGETESDCHGGFDQCCGRPDLHRPVSTAWTPPPPGDRREQLPDAILALIDIPSYTSTACEAAKLLERQMPHALRRVELGDHADRLHSRCRLQNKFTGKPCVCRCHGSAETAVDQADDVTGVWTPAPPIGCLTLAPANDTASDAAQQPEPTPSQLPRLRDQLADATVPLLLDTLPKVIARARGYEVADAVLTLLYREWPWLRAAAEDATPPAAT
jgi:hypothetical protein